MKIPNINLKSITKAVIKLALLAKKISIFLWVKSFSIVRLFTSDKTKTFFTIIVMVFSIYWGFFIFQSDKRPIVTLTPQEISGEGHGSEGITINFDMKLENKGGSLASNVILYHCILYGPNNKTGCKPFDIAYNEIPDIVQGETINYEFKKYITHEVCNDSVNKLGKMVSIFILQYSGSSWVFWKKYQTTVVADLLPVLVPSDPKTYKLKFQCKAFKGPFHTENLFVSKPDIEFKKQLKNISRKITASEFFNLEEKEKKGKYSL